MFQLIGLLMVCSGIILVILGVRSSDSLQNNVSRMVNGHYTDRTTWYLIGGSICCVIGFSGVSEGGVPEPSSSFQDHASERTYSCRFPGTCLPLWRSGRVVIRKDESATGYVMGDAFSFRSKQTR
jgi:hypothetical protein